MAKETAEVIVGIPPHVFGSIIASLSKVNRQTKRVRRLAKKLNRKKKLRRTWQKI